MIAPSNTSSFPPLAPFDRQESHSGGPAPAEVEDSEPDQPEFRPNFKVYVITEEYKDSKKA